jgi:hypothetical protein
MKLLDYILYPRVQRQFITYEELIQVLHFRENKLNETRKLFSHDQFMAYETAAGSSNKRDKARDLTLEVSILMPTAIRLPSLSRVN